MEVHTAKHRCSGAVTEQREEDLQAIGYVRKDVQSLSHSQQRCLTPSTHRCIPSRSILRWRITTTPSISPTTVIHWAIPITIRILISVGLPISSIPALLCSNVGHVVTTYSAASREAQAGENSYEHSDGAHCDPDSGTEREVAA